MSARRRHRPMLRQETLAPWVAMAIILGSWGAAARFVAPALSPDAVARSAQRSTTDIELAAPPSNDAVVTIGATGAAGPIQDDTGDIEALRARDLAIPVAGLPRTALVPTFADRRGGQRWHEALDIMAPLGTAVVAADNGTIAKLFQSKRGGTTIYQFDPSGTFCYYYAHLDSYVPGLARGDAVERGQTIGYVGSTGNASPDAPHLHFAIFRLGPEQRWWKGEPLDPFLVLR